MRWTDFFLCLYCTSYMRYYIDHMYCYNLICTRIYYISRYKMKEENNSGNITRYNVDSDKRKCDNKKK